MTTGFLNIYELITSKEQDSDLSFLLLIILNSQINCEHPFARALIHFEVLKCGG